MATITTKDGTADDLSALVDKLDLKSAIHVCPGVASTPDLAVGNSCFYCIPSSSRMEGAVACELLLDANRSWRGRRTLRKHEIWFCAATLLLLLSIACIASAREGELQVCDVRADYALGVEDYSEAIRLHAEVVRERPDDALAHYHLGFAQGMMGNQTAEVREYQRAAALGLRNWDLFLHLGLAQLENGDLDAATDSLRQAVFLGENHSESHFNLALVYERRGLLADAERETLASLRLNPGQLDARDSLGVIYAQEGRTVRASLVWRELVREVPDYQPARTNLELLGSQNEVARGETAAVVPPPAAAVKAIADESRQP